VCVERSLIITWHHANFQLPALSFSHCCTIPFVVPKSISISLSAVAQKEEEDLRRLREENRPGPIQLPPERLGNVKMKYVDVLI